jgi:hypothetical protein
MVRMNIKNLKEKVHTLVRTRIVFRDAQHTVLLPPYIDFRHDEDKFPHERLETTD